MGRVKTETALKVAKLLLALHAKPLIRAVGQ